MAFFPLRNVGVIPFADVDSSGRILGYTFRWMLIKTVIELRMFWRRRLDGKLVREMKFNLLRWLSFLNIASTSIQILFCHNEETCGKLEECKGLYEREKVMHGKLEKQVKALKSEGLRNFRKISGLVVKLRDQASVDQLISRDKTILHGSVGTFGERTVRKRAVPVYLNIRCINRRWWSLLPLRTQEVDCFHSLYLRSEYPTFS